MFLTIRIGQSAENKCMLSVWAQMGQFFSLPLMPDALVGKELAELRQMGTWSTEAYGFCIECGYYDCKYMAAMFICTKL